MSVEIFIFHIQKVAKCVLCNLFHIFGFFGDDFFFIFQISDFFCFFFFFIFHIGRAWFSSYLMGWGLGSYFILRFLVCHMNVKQRLRPIPSFLENQTFLLFFNILEGVGVLPLFCKKRKKNRKLKKRREIYKFVFNYTIMKLPPSSIRSEPGSKRSPQSFPHVFLHTSLWRGERECCYKTGFCFFFIFISVSPE